MITPTIGPIAFTAAIPDADLADLRERLARTRWPDQAPGDPWAHGVDVAWMRELAAYWRDRSTGDGRSPISTPFLSSSPS